MSWSIRIFNDQQIQIAIRTGITPSPAAKENDAVWLYSFDQSADYLQHLRFINGYDEHRTIIAAGMARMFRLSGHAIGECAGRI